MVVWEEMDAEMRSVEELGEVNKLCMRESCQFKNHNKGMIERV